MAIPGQRFELDLDAPNWTFDIEEKEHVASSPLDVVKEIKERGASADIPPAPSFKPSRTGFPEHRARPVSTFKQRQQAKKSDEELRDTITHRGPSDQAILYHAAKKHGVDLAAAKHGSQIDMENRDRINNMSLEEIEQAREEIMAQFNFKDPGFLQKFLQRADIDTEQEQQQKDWDNHETGQARDPSKKSVAFASAPEHEQREIQGAEKTPNVSTSAQQHPQPSPAPTSTAYTSSVHFPNPPRDKADYKPLDPNSPDFLKDLREVYFPDLPYDPSSLAWLSDPTPAENAASSYNPDRAGFAPSSLRFSFTGDLITPSESLEIPITSGLHHHGDAPSSAGYTIPELALLERSTLPNQRCVAYQVLGRILFKLGRGDFGPRGGEMNEGLWTCIEKERVVEVMMAEAGRDRGHLSAKNYATEALWLWRRGGGGDRGVLKENEKRAT